MIGRYAPEVRPHLHLSLQTGSDRLLKLMGRRYDKAYYRELVQRAYDLIPGFALTTDVIAGLPTETEEEHRETLAFLEELRPTRVHAFTYTPRPKTRAASMPQVPRRCGSGAPRSSSPWPSAWRRSGSAPGSGSGWRSWWKGCRG